MVRNSLNNERLKPLYRIVVALGFDSENTEFSANSLCHFYVGSSFCELQMLYHDYSMISLHADPA
jgi:hypothetical protein